MCNGISFNIKWLWWSAETVKEISGGGGYLELLEQGGGVHHKNSLQVNSWNTEGYGDGCVTTLLNVANST